MSIRIRSCAALMVFAAAVLANHSAALFAQSAVDADTTEAAASELSAEEAAARKAAAQAREALELAEEQAFKEAAVKAGPSLVRIDTVGGLDVVGELIASTAPTTGVVISDDGFIISSAFNFINKPSSVLVTLPDGKRLPATIVASDKLRMITLLKVEASGLKVPESIPADAVQVGQWSIALGRTYDGPLPSISVGIVSALNRVWGKAIQTDAKISPVNYGGPLVDVEGRVMGVLVPLSPQADTDTAGVEWYDSGIGFAIPLADIYQVLPRLKEGKDLRPGLAGITPKGSDLYATEVVLERVRYGSPAAEAGLQPGDVIQAIDGQPVTRLAQMLDELKSHLEGETISVTVKRGAETITRNLTLVGELPPWELPLIGMLPVRDDSQPGIAVRFLDPEGAAAQAGLKAGDRLTRMGDAPITTADALAEALHGHRPDDAVTFEVRRGDQTRTVELKLGRPLNDIPTDLPAAVSVATPAAAAAAAAAPANNTKNNAETDAGAADEKVRTGRFSDKLPGYEQEHWAYVPDDWSADRSWSLLVWLHPPQTTMEATIYKQWKTVCDYRGIVLVAPKADALRGWTENEAEYVNELVAYFRDRYRISPRRIAVHSYAGGCRFATQVAFAGGSPFRGVLMAGAPLSERPPEHSPESLLQFHLIYGDGDRLAEPIQRTIKGLRTLNFPTTERALPGRMATYPEGDAIEEAGRWIDSLDRL